MTIEEIAKEIGKYWIDMQLPETNKDVIVLLSDDTVMMGRFVNDTITRGHHWEIYWPEGLKHIAPSKRRVTRWMPLPCTSRLKIWQYCI